MRTKTFARVLYATLLLLPLWACVAQPDDYPSGAPPGGARSSGGTPGSTNSTCSTWATVLAQRCAGSGCHGATNPAAGLDLASAGVAARLVGQTSAACPGQVLVVAGDPQASYLLDKLGSSPACGKQMPMSGALPADEYNCVSTWIGSLSDTTPGGGGGGGW